MRCTLYNTVQYYTGEEDKNSTIFNRMTHYIAYADDVLILCVCLEVLM
jgi:hypothetical protein